METQHLLEEQLETNISTRRLGHLTNGRGTWQQGLLTWALSSLWASSGFGNGVQFQDLWLEPLSIVSASTYLHISLKYSWWGLSFVEMEDVSLRDQSLEKEMLRRCHLSIAKAPVFHFGSLMIESSSPD